MGELVSGCKGSENDWENDLFSFDQIEGKQEKIVFTCRNWTVKYGELVGWNLGFRDVMQKVCQI